MISLGDVILCGALCISFCYVLSYDRDITGTYDREFPSNPLEECMPIHREARCSALYTEKLASEVKCQNQGQTKFLADMLEPESADMSSVHTSAHGLSTL